MQYNTSNNQTTRQQRQSSLDAQKPISEQQDQISLSASRPSKPDGSNRQALLNRQVFDRNAFNNTINTDFTELISSQDPSFFSLDLATIGDFFELYERFFYEIPKLGDTNSHLYLVETSGEYIDYAPREAEIQALLEEIADLRTENLELRQDFANALGTEFGNSDDGSDRAVTNEPITIPPVSPTTVPIVPSGGSGGSSGGGASGGGGGTPSGLGGETQPLGNVGNRGNYLL